MTIARARKPSATPFPPLPLPQTPEGKPRRVGVEVEFAGLDEARVAQILARTLGGAVEQTGPYLYSLCESEIGDLTVELDISLREKADRRLISEGLDLMRGVIPVEVISGPLTVEALPRFDAALGSLREAGAQGSGQGMLYGFGVHLNPEVPGLSHPGTAAIIRAYGFLEEFLREEDPIDGTRRLLPFVDRWPAGLIDGLAEAEGAALAEIMALYARHTHSRNHGLDLLPLFKHLDATRFQELFGGGTGGRTNARPTFHFRLPDSRIDEAGWSLVNAWAEWHFVETVAMDAPLLRRLSAARLDYRDALLAGRAEWRRRVREILQAAGLMP